MPLECKEFEINKGFLDESRIITAIVRSDASLVIRCRNALTVNECDRPSETQSQLDIFSSALSNSGNVRLLSSGLNSCYEVAPTMATRKEACVSQNRNGVEGQNINLELSKVRGFKDTFSSLNSDEIEADTSTENISNLYRQYFEPGFQPAGYKKKQTPISKDPKFQRLQKSLEMAVQNTRETLVRGIASLNQNSSSISKKYPEEFNKRCDLLNREMRTCYEALKSDNSSLEFKAFQSSECGQEYSAHMVDLYSDPLTLVILGDDELSKNTNFQATDAERFQSFVSSNKNLNNISSEDLKDGLNRYKSKLQDLRDGLSKFEMIKTENYQKLSEPAKLRWLGYTLKALLDQYPEAASEILSSDLGLLSLICSTFDRIKVQNEDRKQGIAKIVNGVDLGAAIASILSLGAGTTAKLAINSTTRAIAAAANTTANTALGESALAHLGQTMSQKFSANKADDLGAILYIYNNNHSNLSFISRDRTLREIAAIRESWWEERLTQTQAFGVMSTVGLGINFSSFRVTPAWSKIRSLLVH